MKVKFFTLGCKVNQYETQALKERFSFLGCEITTGKADLYVINTCTVTARADFKSKEAILRAKKENPKAKITVCGCLVQFNKDFIKKIGVDYIVPQDEKHRLAEIVLSRPFDKKMPDNNWQLKISRFPNQRAFIKVQDGCSNFCSYCKIPYLRGPSQSRSKKEIIEEVKRVSILHKEIVLCGINLSLYGKDLKPVKNLEGLAEDILEVFSLGRLRLSSLESFSLDKKLFTFLEHKKFCPHFHFPFQSGDDRILKEMNKKEKVGLYEDIVRQARESNLDVAISCDIMVGFPSENEQSFNNTVSFLKRIKPMRTHIFTFSPRENTSFFGLKIKNQKHTRKRYDFLKKLAEDFAYEYKSRFLGKTLHMVTEEKTNGFTRGYTENYIKVWVKGELPLGQIVPVKIKKVEKDKVVGLCV
ncbi:MAG: tRNA (N(6)-L-threonylcarbamoyladenosine(37)-C(2))-methylthiotransferase MtaB [Candidatus Omnitrophota bacterium]